MSYCVCKIDLGHPVNIYIHIYIYYFDEFRGKNICASIRHNSGVVFRL